MAKYRVITQAVEIAEKTRDVGTLIDESEFAPAPPMRESDDPGTPHLSELDSLLVTKHIEPE